MYMTLTSPLQQPTVKWKCANRKITGSDSCLITITMFVITISIYEIFVTVDRNKSVSILSFIEFIFIDFRQMTPQLVDVYE